LQVSDAGASDIGTLDGWQINVRGNELINASAPFLAIPDAPAGGVSDSIFTTSKGTVTDLDLSLLSAHTWVGDLVITIEHEETGTTVSLIDRPGIPPGPLGCGNDNINVILDDEAPVPAETQCSGANPAIGGTVSPSGLLSAFDGESIGGTWTLTATDLVGSDTGELTFWALHFTGEGCPSGVNNSFEQGTVSSSIVPCWTVINQPGSAGTWCTQAFATPPACGNYVAPVPAPPAGTQAVMTNQANPASSVLYRCGIPTAAAVGFRAFLFSNAAWNTQPTLDLGGSQQFRADIVSRDGLLDDPFTMQPQHILLTLYQSQNADPVNSGGYNLVTGNMGAFIGQTVCLRFAVVATGGFMIAGVDDVVFPAKEPKSDTDQDDTQNEVDVDDDSDGCADTRENQTAAGSQTSGGLRNPHNFWDFFDVPTGGGLTRNGSIAAPDIFQVLTRFNTVGSPNGDPLSLPPASGYHTAYDRGSSSGPNNWNLTAANGSIAATDVFAVIAQFNHSCA
jgi:subtilisin-like proprotein convertase family protein